MLACVMSAELTPHAVTVMERLPKWGSSCEQGLQTGVADDQVRQTRAMANTKSAKKMVRKITRKTAVNTSRRSRIRTFIRKVEEAIAGGDKKAAEAALRVAQPEIMRGVSNGVLHKNTGSRKVSRLAGRVKRMA